MKSTIELLAPARDTAIGIAAVNHGADAVYIGAPDFSARMAASNSLADIERLVTYAHRYYSRIYVAMNTILSDKELIAAEKLIHQFYNIGVDALIIQDMGLLELDLPPIALHASTQCDNRTVEKVRFLEQCGIEQVVLARELSLAQISEIRQATDVALECFIHGALCVSYSGQCFISQATRGRSANKGNCAQMCRLPYTLFDANGAILAENKHLLSLKDLDASAQLESLIEAGVNSFKIEGRLKNIAYVKNITAYYRKLLDIQIENRDLKRASSGKTVFHFTPNPKKTFYRGATSYFLEGRNTELTSFETPKSLGEPIGSIKEIERSFLTLNNTEILHNGDGLCGFDAAGNLIGFRVNRVDQNRIYPHQMPPLKIGTLLYRNIDAEFDRLMENPNTATRTIQITIALKDTTDGFCFTAVDEDGCHTTLNITYPKEVAKQTERAKETFKTQFEKLGSTEFSAHVIWEMNQSWFVPISLIAEWRRQLIDQLITERQRAYPRPQRIIEKTIHPFPKKQLDFRFNIFNTHAAAFYQRHGATVKEYAFEQKYIPQAELMRTKHCIKYSFGWCPKQKPLQTPPEPLSIKNKNDAFRLEFDCLNCEMTIKAMP